MLEAYVKGLTIEGAVRESNFQYCESSFDCSLDFAAGLRPSGIGPALESIASQRFTHLRQCDTTGCLQVMLRDHIEV